MGSLDFKSESDQLRFESKIDKTGDCHLWLAATWSKGYGQFTLNGKNHRAHRVSYQNYNGDVGDKQVLHSCDNPRCVNPEHLYLGTNQENRTESYDKGRGNTGSKNGNAVLDEQKVSEIRRLWRTGDYTKAELSRKFKISPSVMGGLVKGKGWAHVS